MPFKEKSFDGTICTHVLHLISEWITALEEICRVTRKIVVSTNYVRKSPLREAYRRLIRRYGYESHYPEKGEWELKDLVKPNTIPVTSYERGLDKSLDYMTQRAYSSQWEIPEDVNKKVVNELKHRFGGTAFLQELQILVYGM